MLGKIIDINRTDAYVSFDDGITLGVGIAHLPPNVQIGDTVNIEKNSTKMTNDKYIDFF